jgi:hypothetical protein
LDPPSPKITVQRYHSDKDYPAINEAFAITLAFDMLGIDQKNADKALYDEMYKRLRYHFFYRDVCKKQLFFTLDLLSKTLRR